VKVEQALRQELAALEHELRRVRDALERNRTHELEQRARQLRENITLCESELASALQSDSDRA
jgi:lipid II:glycine glycyltransferase (peptidoglycan interpeptide bridge formation enzyme)